MTTSKPVRGTAAASASLQFDWEQRRRHLLFVNSAGQALGSADESLEGLLDQDARVENDDAKAAQSFDSKRGGAIEELRRATMDELSRIPVDRFASKLVPSEKLALLFDEDEYESKETVKALESLGFSVVTASEPDQALRIYQETRANFDVLLLGLRGPGFETLRFLETVGPVKMPVVLTLSAESCDLSELYPDDAAVQEASSPTSGMEAMFSSSRSLKMSMSFMSRRESTSELVARGIELGVSAYILKPVQREPLARRLRDLMSRFRDAAQEFKRMVDFSDPDYTTKQTRELMFEELARSHDGRTAVKGYVHSDAAKDASQLLPSVDMQGVMPQNRGPRTSKFGLALRRTKAAHNARVRVKRASELNRLESSFLVNTPDPRNKGKNAKRRRSTRQRPSIRGSQKTFLQRVIESGPSGTPMNGDAGTAASDGEAKTAPPHARSTLRASMESSDPTLVLSVIAGLAQKKTRAEGALPLLVDFRGQVSHLQLPWEKKRLENIEKEYGSVPRVRPRDILQSDFREHIPTSRSATSGQRFLQKGYELKVKGDLLGAIRLYTRATLADQRYSAAHLCRGVAYHLLGDDESAMQDFTQCLRIDPKSTSARFNRALILSHEHQDHAAIQELNEAIEIDRSDEGLLAFRAFISRRCGEFARAQEDYKVAANLAAARLRRLEQQRTARAEKRKQRRRERRRQLRGVSAKDAKSEPGSGSDNSASSSDSSDSEDDDDESDDGALRATASMSQLAQGEAEKQRKKWDTNYDGRIDLAEFTSATQRCDSVYAEIFQKRSEVEVACGKPPQARTTADLELIFHACREISLFRKMPQRYIRELAREVKLASVLPGDYIVQQGAPAYNFFAILEGEVHVTVEVAEMDSEHVVHRMYQGECFGENALVADTKRQVNVIVPSTGDTALIFIISKALFFQTRLDETLEEQTNWTGKILRNCQIFDGMARAAFEDLCKITRTVKYEHNTVVLRQGEATSRFCILVSGICRTLRYSDAGADIRRRIRTLEHACEQFEMSFAVHHRNAQDARTTARVARVKELHKDRLEEIKALKTKLAALERGEIRPAKPKLIETGTIYPGNIFGEEALLDPYYGREQYTVVADTYITLLCVHKEQLQTYKHSESLLERVRLKKDVSGVVDDG